jgi:predicted nucleic acid-binding protein
MCSRAAPAGSFPSAACLRRPIASAPILPVTEAISRRFADLKTALRQEGIAKSDVDLLIATTAIEHGATLVTNDSALLAGDVPDLLVESWTSRLLESA